MTSSETPRLLSGLRSILIFLGVLRHLYRVGGDVEEVLPPVLDSSSDPPPLFDGTTRWEEDVVDGFGESFEDCFLGFGGLFGEGDEDGDGEVVVLDELLGKLNERDEMAHTWNW
ncbi:hypothetical protein LOK49_LG02G00778 [Camellia lanceoleosa]|uniref:Uncharacterized protein n=1 Tax=Camellia lanceoleosa TaxID=1840588 RepID=A0ACC0INZ2_9ERIC|nr:hypothetical protein LOK49_LG02G00778 [Camellia lanceoleosa]